MNPNKLLGLALLVVATSCSDATGPVPQTKALEAARQQWRNQNLHTYAFTLQRSCFCGNTHPLYIAVLNDAVVAVLDLEAGTELDPKLGETVEDLFTFVETAINRSARLIRVDYDAAKGFPTEIDYDGAAQIADDEIFFRVTDVHPIPPRP